jgi:peptidyl-prolyl cis-trans isomerase C
MQKKYLFATTAAIIVLVAGAFTYKVSAEKNNGVAAIVNGEKITVAEIQEAYDQNPQLKQIPFEEFYNHAVDVMVNSKLALQAADKANIKQSAEYLEQLKQVEDDLARQMYLDKRVQESITDEAVQKIYNEYVAKFEPQEEVSAKHILVDTEEEANEVIAKLEAKEASFDDLARQYSKDNPNLGYFTAEMMVPEFSDAVFKMKKGEFSKEPVKTEFGYHVILVEDLRETKPLDLAEVEPQIKAGLAQEAIAKIVEELNKNAEVEKFDLNGKKIENKEAE